MPGHQHGDQFVADFLVAHGLTVLVAGGDEHGHDVGALLRAFLLAAVNFVVQQPVDFTAKIADSFPGRERSQIDLQPGNHQQR